MDPPSFFPVISEPYINFFCSEEHLARWQEKNPELANGETYTIHKALRHGRMIFEDFLR